MSARSLLSRFDLIADAPGNIQRLRKLIVNLAIGGRLPGSPDEEGLLGERLKVIESKKQNLTKVGRIKKPTVTRPINATELPTGCHDTDRFQRLQDIAILEKGLTAIQSATPGDFPLVVTAEGRSSADHYDFDGCAAIIPMVSSSGHGNASLKRLHYQEGKFALGNILCAAFPISDELISARFIFEYLTAFKEELLVSKMIGTANVSLTLGKIGEVPVPIVSPAAQRRVDELMALCDRLEEAQKGRDRKRDQLVTASLHHLDNAADGEASQKHAHFFVNHLSCVTARISDTKQLRQLILNLAISGRLVPQNSSGRQPPSSVEEELGSLVTVVRGSSPRPKGDPRYYGGPIPRLLIADITRDGKHVTPKIDSLTEEGAGLSRPMQRGSLVLAISGSYGVPAFLAVDACIHDGFIGFRNVSNELSLEYLFYVLLWRKPYFDSVVKDSGLKNLTTDHLKRMPVPLPLLSDQQRIVAKLEQLMVLCDKLDERIISTQTESRRLLESVLHHALSDTLPRAAMASLSPSKDDTSLLESR